LGLGALPAQKNVAVLPFANVGGSPQNQPFCDGLTYTLTSKLTQLEQFHGSLLVVPASDVLAEEVESVEDARRKFGVSLVLAGSVQRAGEEVLVNLTLVDANSRRQLRSFTVETGADAPTLLPGGLALQAARLLELELAPRDSEVLAAGRTGVVRANDYYLEGRGYLQRYEDPDNIDVAIAQFDRALQQDPDFALAYAGLGEAYWKRYEATRQPQWAEEARKACEQALALDKRSPEPHTCLGAVFNGTGDYGNALVEFQHALERNPASDNAHRGLAAAYEAQGKLEEAEETYKHAIALRPSYWGSYRELGVFYFRHGRYDDAAAMFRSCTELAPDNARAYTSLGGIFYLQGRWEQAEQLYEQSLAIRETSVAYSNLGTVYFFQGRFAEAVRMFEQATALQPNDYLLLGNLADAYRWTSGLKSKAGPAYRHAIELAQVQLEVNPRDPDVRSDLAVYWVKMGEPEKALAAMAAARKQAPNDVNVLFQSVVVYYLAGQRARAVDALIQAIQAGYSLAEIRADPELVDLRRDLRYQRAVAARSGGG
jgi:serine/threonine-protein kinase